MGGYNYILFLTTQAHPHIEQFITTLRTKHTPSLYPHLFKTQQGAEKGSEGTYSKPRTYRHPGVPSHQLIPLLSSTTRYNSFSSNSVMEDSWTTQHTSTASLMLYFLKMMHKDPIAVRPIVFGTNGLHLCISRPLFSTVVLFWVHPPSFVVETGNFRHRGVLSFKICSNSLE